MNIRIAPIFIVWRGRSYDLSRLLLISVVLSFIIGFMLACNREVKPDCTWVCEAGASPPNGCGCLEDIINREFKR